MTFIIFKLPNLIKLNWKENSQLLLLKCKKSQSSEEYLFLFIRRLMHHILIEYKLEYLKIWFPLLLMMDMMVYQMKKIDIIILRRVGLINKEEKNGRENSKDKEELLHGLMKDIINHIYLLLLVKDMLRKNFQI